MELKTLLPDRHGLNNFLCAILVFKSPFACFLQKSEMVVSFANETGVAIVIHFLLARSRRSCFLTPELSEEEILL